jgi:hypothetical protein
VNEYALGWLRAMVSPAPAPLRHTVPAPALLGDAQLPANETLAALQRYAWQCVGLCIGGTCLTCDAIADQISASRLAPDDQRGARDADLMQQINALKEGS